MPTKKWWENLWIYDIINIITTDRKEKLSLFTVLKSYVKTPNMDSNIKSFSEDLMNLLDSDFDITEKEKISHKLNLKISKNSIDEYVDILLWVLWDIKKPKYNITFLSTSLYNALSDRKRDNI